MVPLILLPLLVRLPPTAEAALLALDWFIWAAFALDYAVRLALTPHRWQFIRRQWPDLVIVVVPFLRPLRIARSARALRALRLARLVALLTRINREARRLVVRHRLHYAVLITGVVVLAAAGTVFLVEERGGGTIDSFGDALWWAATTVTTVGYGDTFPVTPAGRGIAVALMIAGIAFFSLLTANIAAFFVERTPGDNAESTKLDEILQRLDAIEAQLRERRPS
jgi:voltage-gated potassium channel